MVLKAKEREARIKQTKEYILRHTSASLLNNKKWYDIFEKLQDDKIRFELKLLLSDDIRTCDFIREVELTSVLIDDTGNCIDFLEIEFIAFESIKDLSNFLDNLNAGYIDNSGWITVRGYQK